MYTVQFQHFLRYYTLYSKLYFLCNHTLYILPLVHPHTPRTVQAEAPAWLRAHRFSVAQGYIPPLVSPELLSGSCQSTVQNPKQLTMVGPIT